MVRLQRALIDRAARRVLMKPTLNRFILNTLWNQYVIELGVLIKARLLPIPQVELDGDVGSIALVNKLAGEVWYEVFLYLLA